MFARSQKLIKIEAKTNEESFDEILYVSVHVY